MTTAPPPTADPVAPDVPRVLLFGHRGAGKSALLGALLRAGETQGETLRAEVVTSSAALPRIRDTIYAGGQLAPSKKTIDSYVIRLRPWRVGTQPVGEPLTVILDDCAGSAAEELLEHPEPITRRAPDSPLARAVAETDAIMLLVDASSNNEELAEAFEEFDKFLTVVSAARTDARDVGGFPIFLVLTQGDRLAQAGDTMARWEKRLSERESYALKKFQPYLRDADEDEGVRSPFLSFGTFDLNVMTVAVRLPDLSGGKPPTNQTTQEAAHQARPYHVAELFRDCFSGAKAYHDRTAASNRRLRWTVRVALAAVGILLVGLVVLALFPPHSEGPTLADRVKEYRDNEPSPGERLDTRTERHRRALLAFRSDAAYPNLKPELREYVESRLKELDDYRDYMRLIEDEPGPTDPSVRRLPALHDLRGRLQTTLAPPAGYVWEGTVALALYRKMVTDVDLIGEVVNALVQKYGEFTKRGDGLLLRAPDEGWRADVTGLVTAAGQAPLPLDPPLPLDELIPNSPTIEGHPAGRPVTHRVAYSFDEVTRRGGPRDYWQATRQQLLHVRSLATVLGAFDPTSPEALLVLPPPGPGVDSAALAAERWKALVAQYGPGATDPGIVPQPDTFPRWAENVLYRPVRDLLGPRAAAAFETGLRHVRPLLTWEDTLPGWKRTADTLTDPKLRDWGRLLQVLARVENASAPDPVAELAEFVRDLDSKTFPLDLGRAELVIPHALTETFERVEAPPGAVLTVRITRPGAAPQVGEYIIGAGLVRDVGGKKYTHYALSPKGTPKLDYRAGDEVRAELPVRAGKQELQLVWDGGKSAVFRFDALMAEPRLHRPGFGPRAATGVRLALPGDRPLVKFPALFPRPR